MHRKTWNQQVLHPQRTVRPPPSQEDVLHQPASFQVRRPEPGSVLVQEDGANGPAEVVPLQLGAQGRHLVPDVHGGPAVLQDGVLQDV